MVKGSETPMNIRFQHDYELCLGKLAHTKARKQPMMVKRIGSGWTKGFRFLMNGLFVSTKI
jgi:hypothetical protein